jgi:hypothetical protein
VDQGGRPRLTQFPHSPLHACKLLTVACALRVVQVVEGFNSTNQGYFMPLFFFVSGYFTPRSYARKGTREFVRDKLVRLGVPYLVYFFALQPLVWCFINYKMGLPKSCVPSAARPPTTHALRTRARTLSACTHPSERTSTEPADPARTLRSSAA